MAGTYGVRNRGFLTRAARIGAGAGVAGVNRMAMGRGPLVNPFQRMASSNRMAGLSDSLRTRDLRTRMAMRSADQEDQSLYLRGQEQDALNRYRQEGLGIDRARMAQTAQLTREGREADRQEALAKTETDFQTSRMDRNRKIEEDLQRAREGDQKQLTGLLKDNTPESVEDYRWTGDLASLRRRAPDMEAERRKQAAGFVGKVPPEKIEEFVKNGDWAVLQTIPKAQAATKFPIPTADAMKRMKDLDRKATGIDPFGFDEGPDPQAAAELKMLRERYGLTPPAAGNITPSAAAPAPANPGIPAQQPAVPATAPGAPPAPIAQAGAMTMDEQNLARLSEEDRRRVLGIRKFPDSAQARMVLADNPHLKGYITPAVGPQGATTNQNSMLAQEVLKQRNSQDPQARAEAAAVYERDGEVRKIVDQQLGAMPPQQRGFMTQGEYQKWRGNAEGPRNPGIAPAAPQAVVTPAPAPVQQAPAVQAAPAPAAPLPKPDMRDPLAVRYLKGQGMSEEQVNQALAARGGQPDATVGATPTGGFMSPEETAALARLEAAQQENAPQSGLAAMRTAALKAGSALADVPRNFARPFTGAPSNKEKAAMAERDKEALADWVKRVMNDPRATVEAKARARQVKQMLGVQ